MISPIRLNRSPHIPMVAPASIIPTENDSSSTVSFQTSSPNVRATMSGVRKLGAAASSMTTALSPSSQRTRLCPAT